MPHKTPRMREIEQLHKDDIRNILIDLYYKKNLSLDGVGKVLGVDRSTICLWLKILDMPSKTLRAAEIPERYKGKGVAL